MITRTKEHPVIYLIATPIGNLKDITLRALEVLKTVDVLYAEDTRVTKVLLNHYEIKREVRSYHSHNEDIISEEMIMLLQEGKSIGICSDAGTPLISDPGYTLIKKIKNDYKIESIPGPTAYISALITSGFPTQPNTFIGFLDPKSSKRESLLQELKYYKSTLIFYERGTRLNETIRDMYKVFGNRKAVLSRELTKLHETHYDFNLEETLDIETRGEFVLMVEGYIKEEVTKERILEEVEYLMRQGLTRKEAVLETSKRLDVPKNKVYQEVIK